MPCVMSTSVTSGASDSMTPFIWATYGLLRPKSVVSVMIGRMADDRVGEVKVHSDTPLADSPAMNLSRRQFLAASATGVAAGSLCSHSRAAEDEVVSFFVIGDTHFLANKESPGEVDAASQSTNAALVDALNGLSGADIPAAAGGGKVLS